MQIGTDVGYIHNSFTAETAAVVVVISFVLPPMPPGPGKFQKQEKKKLPTENAAKGKCRSY